MWDKSGGEARPVTPEPKKQLSFGAVAYREAARKQNRIARLSQSRITASSLLTMEIIAVFFRCSVKLNERENRAQYPRL